MLGDLGASSLLELLVLWFAVEVCAGNTVGGEGRLLGVTFEV